MANKEHLEIVRQGAKDQKEPFSIPQSMRVPERLGIAFWRQANIFQLIYSLAGLLLGLACVIGGMVLFLHGVTGSSSWTAKILGAESTVTDAAPGVILFIVGLFIVFVTRYVIKVQDKK